MRYAKKLNFEMTEWEKVEIEVPDTTQVLFESDLKNEIGGMATRLINKGTLGFASFTAEDAANSPHN